MKVQLLVLIACVGFALASEAAAPELPSDLEQPDQDLAFQQARPAGPVPLAPLEDAEQPQEQEEPAQEEAQEEDVQPEEDSDEEASEDSDESDDSEQKVLDLLEKMNEQQQELDFLNRYLVGRLAPIDRRRRPWIGRPFFPRPRPRFFL
ncbi:glucosidase 2 subunit beta-like [Anopheles cruzii]|uniref:glucosidase 2 subunit beta-like n=1 Tax=Anopheles cruzii TaxID=68878 RepID=UPI0022EC8C7A|nr:glucosidase 2 subunit beta-like [Anopheles cruzii]